MPTDSVSRWSKTLLPLVFVVALQITLPAFSQSVGIDASEVSGFGHPYVYDLEKKVSKFWEPPNGKQWKDLAVRLKLQSNGTIADLKTSHSSSSKNIDNLALKAVKQASPFSDLPAGASNASFELHFECPKQIVPETVPMSEANGQSPANKLPNPAQAAVAAVQDIDFGPYMADLQNRIEKSWKPIVRPIPRRAILLFKVHKGGDISNLRIDRSSGDIAVDKVALDAVTNTAPFRALPGGAGEDIHIQFTFNQPGPFGSDRSGGAWVGWIRK